MIFENDTLSVKSKKSAAEHIIERYDDFGWTLTKREDDKLYDNITHLTFTRPHLIENRDGLQLLQVRLEIAYNAMGKLSAKIPARASLLGSFFALLALGCIAGGVLLFVLISGTLPIILGSILCAVGITLGIAGGLLTNRIYKKDKEKYTLLIEEQVKKIDGLCVAARSLRGEHE